MPRYQVDLKRIDGDAKDKKELSIQITNHDDLFKIMDAVKSKKSIDDSEVAEFVIGLKLFTDIMLRHRKNPLFEDLLPQMKIFMKKLKSS